jgi:hypothetical protein
MSDLAIMGVVLGGVLGTLTIIIFAIQEREASKRALELKMFQMENMRIVQQLAKTTEEISPIFKE